MAILVASPENIPSDIAEVLSSHAKVLRSSSFLEQLLEFTALRDACIALNDLCITAGIIGFHYTRASKVSIEQHGLLIVNGAERRTTFLKEHGHRFTAAQLERIANAWSTYFVGAQSQSREGYVWFALTTTAMDSGAATPLLNHFGGEAIYMPISKDPEITPILRSIGEPLIVECALDPQRLRAFHEYPWGAVWLSSYHCSVNPEASQYDQDVRALYSVPAADIISIRRAETGLQLQI